MPKLLTYFTECFKPKQGSSSTSITQLPEYIFSKIAPYLSARELFKLALTCRLLQAYLPLTPHKILHCTSVIPIHKDSRLNQMKSTITAIALHPSIENFLSIINDRGQSPILRVWCPHGHNESYPLSNKRRYYTEPIFSPSGDHFILLSRDVSFQRNQHTSHIEYWQFLPDLTFKKAMFSPMALKPTLFYLNETLLIIITSTKVLSLDLTQSTLVFNKSITVPNCVWQLSQNQQWLVGRDAMCQNVLYFYELSFIQTLFTMKKPLTLNLSFNANRFCLSPNNMYVAAFDASKQQLYLLDARTGVHCRCFAFKNSIQNLSFIDDNTLFFTELKQQKMRISLFNVNTGAYLDSLDSDFLYHCILAHNKNKYLFFSNAAITLGKFVDTAPALLAESRTRKHLTPA